MTERHRVSGLVHDGLTAAGVTFPADVARMLSSAAEGITRQNLKLAVEALTIRRSFGAADIPVLFLKGTALSLLAYGNLSIKTSFDVDVLVPRASVKDACSVLRQSGYARVAPDGSTEDDRFDGWIATAREASFRQSERDTLVDLHWQIAADRAVSRCFALWSASQSIEISAGVRLNTLGDEDLFAFLCLHGAHHAWFRLKWLADLHAWIAVKSADEICRLYREADDRGAKQAARQALLLCQVVFGLSLPSAIADDIRADRVSRWLMRMALRAMGCDGRVAETEDRIFGGLDIVLSQFLLSPGPSNWFAVFSTYSIGYRDYERLALPRSLFFLYPLLRAPSWIWRHLSRLLKS